MWEGVAESNLDGGTPQRKPHFDGGRGISKWEAQFWKGGRGIPAAENPRIKNGATESPQGHKAQDCNNFNPAKGAD